MKRSRRLRPGLGEASIAGVVVATLMMAPASAQTTPAPDAAAPQAPAPAEQSDTATRRLTIRFLTESDYPPFNFLDEEGVLTGFNVDLARAICLEAGTACDVRARAWDELLPALRRGETDAVVAGHAISPVTLVDAEFSDRYFFTPGRFVARRDDDDGPITPDSLEDRRIQVVRGTAHEAFLRAYFPDSQIQPVASTELARDALAQGGTDYVFDDAVSLAFWLNGSASRQCCEFKGGAFLEPRFFGDGLAVALSRNDPDLRKVINEALKRIRENGRMAELVQRYFPHRIY